MTADDLKNILSQMAQTDKELFLRVIAWAEAFSKIQDGPEPGPLVPGGQAVNVSPSSASGRDYTLKPSAVSDEDKSAYRQGLADGASIDRLIAYASGLLTGVSLMGGGV